jgi:hypothetical protein
MQPNQEKPYATQIQAQDIILGDQWTGAYDANGNPVYVTKGFPGALFPQGNGAVALPPGTLLANPLSSGDSNFGQPVALDPLQFTIDSGNNLHLAPAIADNLTAQGSLQTNGLALSSLVNVFTTVAAGTAAVLFAVQKGVVIEVWNFGVHPLTVFPPGGGTINAGSVNGDVGINPSSVLRFRCRSAASGASVWLAG